MDYDSNMMKKCDNLRQELENGVFPYGKHLDMLSQYRKWFDDQEIASEAENGWPKNFVFDKENIKAFIKYFIT